MNTNNINQVPAGALLAPGLGDPNSITGGAYDAYRPLAGFQDINIANHTGYQNYNSFQVTWLRTKGHYNINLNYTYGKSLGITSYSGDGFNLNQNYGVMPNDRRQIFNAAYSIELGNPYKGNAMVKGFVNGWQLSGISQIQSGVNLVANTGGNYNIQTNGYNNILGYDVSNQSISGTQSIALRPMYTCDANSNLGTNQFVNGSCLSLPTIPGFNGPTVAKPVYGPMFINNDLGMFKNFQISESKKIQLRFNSYNFLNHPLWSFRSGSSNLNANFDGTTGLINNPNFGVTTEKQGKRIVQVAVKFYF